MDWAMLPSNNEYASWLHQYILRNAELQVTALGRLELFAQLVVVSVLIRRKTL
uniref:Uncharacterized protein n=1 Tax=Arundo donax TaxID=35708 RepID=A0A0A9DDH8_ARUDO